MPSEIFIYSFFFHLLYTCIRIHVYVLRLIVKITIFFVFLLKLISKVFELTLSTVFNVKKTVFIQCLLNSFILDTQTHKYSTQKFYIIFIY